MGATPDVNDTFRQRGRIDFLGESVPFGGEHSEPGPPPADPSRSAIAYTLEELDTVQFPPRRPLLVYGDGSGPADVIFEAGSLVELFAPRGKGKSLFATGIGIALASQGRIGPWRAVEPVNVCIIDGEMPRNLIRERARSQAAAAGLPTGGRLSFIAADWQADPLPRLDTPEGQALVHYHVERADVVILDNASCLFDPASESDPEAWQAAQHYLLMLRRAGKCVILVHHANRAGTARGHSRREDVLDVVLGLADPDTPALDGQRGARFKVTFAKARAIYGEAAEPFVMALDEGMAWTVEAAPSSGDRETTMRADILEFVRSKPGCRKADVVGNVRGREQTLRDAVENLVEGKVLRRTDGKLYAV